jgi:hypothetical protein
MTVWALLAPGPSATAEQAARIHAAGIPLGAVGNAYQLAPAAAFIAATDSAWWRKYPDARTRACPKFSMHPGAEVTLVEPFGLGYVNSGVLALECAKRAGATKVLLLGFDMHGSHFFGAYANGLRNTAPHQRKQHLQQFERWGRSNPAVVVVNLTTGSAMKCFPREDLNACLAEPPVHAA